MLMSIEMTAYVVTVVHCLCMEHAVTLHLVIRRRRTSLPQLISYGSDLAYDSDLAQETAMLHACCVCIA